MRVFYVLPVKEKRLSECLDAIRFLCNPSEKQKAHITVRGPYQKKIDVRSINEKVLGKIVSIDGVGNFFGSNQNTVFFRCSAPILREIWHKQDFPFNPHLTIYDGSSGDFAHRLYKLISNHTYALRFRAEELEPIVARRGQNSLDLALSFNSELVRRVVGAKVSVSEVQELSEERRLEMIEKLCKHLASLALKRRQNSLKRRQNELPFVTSRQELPN